MKKGLTEIVFILGNIGIHADRAVTYQCDEEGTALNYEVMGAAI